MLPLATLASNINRIMAVAGPSDIRNGVAWYPNARAIVDEWAALFQHDPRTVAAVIAALSPQLEWRRNLVIAADILAGHAPSIGTPVALPRNVGIAEAIRDTRATSLDAYFKQGHKVKAFAANLAGDLTRVTVDTHGAQIAAGSPLANLRVDTLEPYTRVARAYATVAGRYGLAPATLQAITWLTWKRLYPRDTKRIARSTKLQW